MKLTAGRRTSAGGWHQGSQHPGRGHRRDWSRLLLQLDRNAQLRADAQLDLAAGQNLPVVIHTREADDDTRSVLSDTLARKGVIPALPAHWLQYCLSEDSCWGSTGLLPFEMPTMSEQS